MFLVLFFLVTGASTIYAAPSFNLDFYNVTNWDKGEMDTGKTMLLPVNYQGNILIDLYLSSGPGEVNDLSSGLIGYTLNFSWLSSLLTYSGAAFAVPSPYFNAGRTSSAVPGVVTIDALCFSGYPSTRDILLGTISLSMNQDAVGTSPLILSVLDAGGANVMLANGDVLDYLLPQTLGTISNVPIPGAIWLLGSGLLGLIGLRRKNS